MAKNKIHYATIVIKVLAHKQEVNGPNELALSDEVQEVSEAIESFLARCNTLHGKFEKFEFSIDIE
jgi:negative regulator of replication initiation